MLNKRSSASLWALWVLISILAEVVASFFISDWILDQIGAMMPDHGIEWLIGIATLTGGLLGLAQLLLLRLCLVRITWLGWATWIFGAIAGAVVRWNTLGWIGAGRLNLEDGAVGRLIGAVIAGAVIGGSQWLVLRHHFTAGWWLVLANIAALSLSLPMWVLVGGGVDLIYEGPSIEGIIVAVIKGVIFGAIVGGILARILLERTILKKAREETI